MALEHITTHSDQAVARMRQMNKARMEFIVRAFGDQWQQVEDGLFGSIGARTLAQATGATLDAIGALYDVPRIAGLSDAIYRNLIAGGIAANVSRGTAEDIINTTLALFSASAVFLRTPNSVHVDTAPPAVVTVGVGSPQLPRNAFGYALVVLSRALPAATVLDQVFTFDSNSALAMEGDEPWVAGLGTGKLADVIYTSPTK